MIRLEYCSRWMALRVRCSFNLSITNVTGHTTPTRTSLGTYRHLSERRLSLLGSCSFRALDNGLPEVKDVLHDAEAMFYTRADARLPIVV
jgi:hypothetical protein